MTNDKPVTVVTETDPTTPEDTVVTARFNRKKIVQIVGAATAAVAALTAFGAAMKVRGQAELIRDLRDVEIEDNNDETVES